MKKVKNLQTKKREKIIFYTVMCFIPVVQILIFYFGVNINSILMSFKEYDFVTGKSEWNVLGNFKRFFSECKTEPYFKRYFLNSFKAAFWTIIVGTLLSLMFSLYIYSKSIFSTFFKVMLFMPSIISSIVMATTFSHFVDSAIPKFFDMQFGIKIKGLLANAETKWGTLIFYVLWCGFGSNILLYVGGMNNISPSLSEAAKLDGANFFQESIYVTLPLIYPTITTFITVSSAAILTNTMGLYTFYENSAGWEYTPVGYWLFVQVKQGEINPDAYYPYLAAIGILLSFIEIPLALGVRKLMTAIGPKVD